MLKKIYLAVPYSGMEKESFEQVTKLAGKLLMAGYIVFSPITHAVPIKNECGLPDNWEFWKQYDEKFIDWCDELWVLCLNDWELSTGVLAEIRIAHKLKKTIRLIPKKWKKFLSG